VDTKYLKLVVDKNGHEFVQRKIGRRGAVVIIPSTADGKFQFILSKRPTFKLPVLEFPAGLIDDDESISEAALRELKEETGWDNGEITWSFNNAPSSAGLSTELLHIRKVLLKG